MRRSFFQNSFLLSLDAVIAAFFTGIFWLLAARLSTAKEVGITSTIIAAASLLALLSRLGFDYAIPFFYPKVSQKIKLLYTAYTTSTLVAVGLSALFLISLNFWLPDLHFLIESPFWSTCFLLLTACLLLINLFLSTAITINAIPWVIAQDLLQNGGRLLVVGILVLSGRSNNAQTFLLSFLLSALGSVILGYWKIAPEFSLSHLVKVEKKLLKEVRGYALKSHGSSLLATAPGFLIPIIITLRLGSEKTAIFSICWMIFAAIGIFHGSLASISFAECSRDSSLLKNKFPSVIYLAWMILVLILGLVFLGGKFALNLFGPSYYTEGQPLLILLTLAGFMLVINDFTATIHRALSQIKPVYFIIGGTGFGFLLLTFIISPYYGLLGVGIAYLASQAVVAISALTFDTKNPFAISRTD